jgi:hypothetical protein
MNKGIEVDLWIKDFVNDEWNLKQIPNYLKGCHSLRKLLGLKEISDADLVKQQLRRYYEQKQVEIKKKLKREAKNGS